MSGVEQIGTRLFDRLAGKAKGFNCVLRVGFHVMNSKISTDAFFNEPAHPRLRRNLGLITLSLAVLVIVPLPTFAADLSGLLWEIGWPDNNNREFALAPNRYGEFRQDGFFVVGQSNPKRDWPYVHPGPDDAWAGGRQHTFVIVFGLKAAPSSGECKLRFDLIDTHSQSPSRLGVRVNGRDFTHKTPTGAGDASVFGNPSKGKEHKFEVSFPAGLLKPAANEIAITTVSGSWVLYDWIGLETPPGLELDTARGTVVSSIDSRPVLVERNGRLMQTVNVALRHFGEPAMAQVRVEGVSPQSVALNQGETRVEVAIPAVDAMEQVGVNVDVGGTALVSRNITLKPVRKWVVYLLPHSHVDIGYTHVQTDVEKAQWSYLEMAMDAARKSASNPPGSRFKWNVEVLWAVDSYLRQVTPDKRQRFVEAVKCGEVGLQALYGNELTGLCSQEELLRLLNCAQRVAKLCDRPITSAMITDVPGCTWGIVPAFAHSGVRYFSVGPNGGDRIGHTAAAWGDKPFWWVGPNGKDKVLLWMTGTGYYRVFSSDANLLNYLNRLDESGYQYDFVQVRHCLGDNGAPDVNFADTVKKWNEKYAYPKLVISTTDDMFRDFEQRYGDKIPTASGDFTPYWEDGAASSALETAMNRASADRLIQAETLFAMFNPAAYSAEGFYQAWRNVILYDEHTWGAHNSISEPDHPFVKSQWAIKRQFALDADKQSRELLASADAARGPIISPSPTGKQGQGQAKGPPAAGNVQAIDVINTTGCDLSWTLVSVPKELSRAGDQVRLSAANTESVVAQRLTTGELVFRHPIGMFCTRRWYVSKGEQSIGRENYPGAAVDGITLAAPDSAVARAVTLRLDENTGGIASLNCAGRELVDTNAPTRLNDYFYLPGGDLRGLQRSGPVKVSVKEKGPLIASLVVESDAPGCNKLTREYRLHALRNYIEVINVVDKKAVRSKEGVHFGFGFNVPGGTVRMDVPWAIVRPEEDQLPGACKNWFTVQRYIDISNAEFGVTWLTPDAPLVQVGGITANLIGSLPDTRAWKKKIEPSATIYSWAMNNHWHTNYRAEQEGPVVFRYFIIPHLHQEPGRAARAALEMSQPLLVLAARGDEPAQRPFVSVSGALVTSFKPAEDGKAWIIRLFGVSGENGHAMLEWSRSPKAIWLSDASEKPLLAAAAPFEVPAWSIVTLRADFPQ